MRQYTKELFNEVLNGVNFPNYEDFDDVNTAFIDFSTKFRQIVNNIAPFKTAKVKKSSQEWFDREIAEKIAHRDKVYKNFKRSRSDIDKELFTRAKVDAIGIINRKKNTYFKNKLNENIGNSKEIWKVLKDVGVTKSKKSQSNFCLKEGNEFIFDKLNIANIFKSFFGNLAKQLVNLLPIASNKYNYETFMNL